MESPRHPLGSRLAALLVLATSVLGSCADNDDGLRERIAAAGVYSPRRIAGGQTELVALGQLLFFDRELSGNRNIACATCHLPPEHAADDHPLGIGEDGSFLSRGTLEPFNRGAASAFFWDGRLEVRDGRIVSPVPLPEGIDTLLEAQALLPLLDRHEMRGQDGDLAVDGSPNELAALPDDASTEIWAAIVARLLSFAGYRDAFARAFPTIPLSEIGIVHVARAIAAFESHLWELTDTAFDNYLAGDEFALGPPQRRGALLFFGEAGCARCHRGPLLSDGAFYNIGVPQIGPGRDAAQLDEGRMLVTGDPRDRFAFRTPALRNVTLTAPYMHDGAYAFVESALRHHLEQTTWMERYDGSELPSELRGSVHREATAALRANLADTTPLRPLSEDDIQDLLVFLDALTSGVERSVRPNAGIPAAVPSGLPIDGPPGDEFIDAGIPFERPDAGGPFERSPDGGF